jgi:hypothetical protein
MGYPSPPNQGSPTQNAQWWAGLTEAQRDAAIADHSATLGNMNGIPARVRDEVNRARIADERAALEARKAQLEDRLARSPARWLTDAFTNDDRALQIVNGKLEDLDAVRDAVAVPDRQLLLLDLSGERGKAAIAVGDVDTAANVAVFTPGLNTTLGGDLSSTMRQMDALRSTAAQIAATQASDSSVATIAWIGYETPQTHEVLNLDRSVASDHQARVGGQALSSFLTGIDTARDSQVHLVALGHSYGSTATGFALQDSSVVDDVVFFGSPGLGTGDIGDLHVPEGHVFVEEAKNDPVADLGRFGPDPNHLAGVTDLSTAGGTSPDGVARTESTGHSEYLASNSMSQYNLAAVVVGADELLAQGDNSGVGDALRTDVGIGAPIVAPVPWLIYEIP